MQEFSNVGELSCRNCGEKFQSKRSLLDHRKHSHFNTVAFCRNYQEGKCPFTSEMCWWNHRELSDARSDVVGCYICNETFENKSEMMLHRKIMHPNHVRACQNFMKNNCRLQSKYCWFSHTEAMETETEVETNKEDNIEHEKESDSVFQKVAGNKEPPIGGKKKKQKTE